MAEPSNILFSNLNNLAQIITSSLAYNQNDEAIIPDYKLKIIEEQVESLLKSGQSVPLVERELKNLRRYVDLVKRNQDSASAFQLIGQVNKIQDLATRVKIFQAQDSHNAKEEQQKVSEQAKIRSVPREQGTEALNKTVEQSKKMSSEVEGKQHKQLPAEVQSHPAYVKDRVISKGHAEYELLLSPSEKENLEKITGTPGPEAFKDQKGPFMIYRDPNYSSHTILLSGVYGKEQRAVTLEITAAGGKGFKVAGKLYTSLNEIVKDRESLSERQLLINQKFEEIKQQEICHPLKNKEEVKKYLSQFPKGSYLFGEDTNTKSLVLYVKGNGNEILKSEIEVTPDGLEMMIQSARFSGTDIGGLINSLKKTAPQYLRHPVTREDITIQKLISKVKSYPGYTTVEDFEQAVKTKITEEKFKDQQVGSFRIFNIPNIEDSFAVFIKMPNGIASVVFTATGTNGYEVAMNPKIVASTVKELLEKTYKALEKK